MGPGEECDNRSFRCHDCLYSRIVFLSSIPLSGNVGPDAEKNLRIADNLCQTLAVQGGLALAQSGRVFRAWLSTSQVAAGSRLTLGEGPYFLPTGEIVLRSGVDILGGNIEHPINVSEQGEPGIETFVWTGTMAEGGSHVSTCSGWTSSKVQGSVGGSWREDQGWIQVDLASCQSVLPIYCFEVLS